MGIKVVKIREHINAIYIGRGSRSNQESPLHNPFKMNDYSDNERNRVCDEYKEYFYNKMTEGTDEIFIQAVQDIANKYIAGEDVKLGCFCSPLKCHGDTIKNWIESCSEKR